MIYLSEVYDIIWRSNKFSDTRRLTTKNGEDNTNPDNDCLSVLTSFRCKTMECMIKNRLTGFLESNGQITNLQSRFCKKRGIIDHFVRLKTFLKEVFFLNGASDSYVFLDRKTYKSIWKHGIMRDCCNLSKGY